MKKILVVGSSLNDKGGIVTVMNNIANSSIKEEFKFDMVETYITGTKKEKVSIFFNGIIKLLKLLISEKPDLVHIHMSYKGSFYRKSIILMLIKLFNVPVLLHVHGSSFKDFYSSLNFIGRAYCNFILNKSDKLIVLSKEWYDYFSKFVKKENIAILYNGVDTIEQTFQRHNSTPIALFMGRLGKRKGIYDLLKSIKLLNEKKIECEFLLAGDGEIEKVKIDITKLNIKENVRVLGWINNEQKRELLIKSDILVLPSYNEGLPMAILEGMSYGLPIISTPVGGIPEAVKDDINGYLVEPGDIEGLASSLEKLIVNPKLRISMGGTNQKAIQENFSLKSLMDSLEEIYNNTIERNK
jgi:glycosyltransferase involved in cell wall biosynthesis